MIEWLLGTLLATSALIVLVLLVREPVRRHFGARVAYGLWLIPAARLLMPTLTRTIERPLADAHSLQPFVPAVLAEPKLLAAVANPEPTLIDYVGGWPAILVMIWLGVALGLFLRGMMAFRRDRKAILAASDTLARIGSIRIVRSSLVKGPLAFGIFDRVIAVPADFDRRFGDCERRLALDHELSHHRSGDLVANLGAFVVLCLQWFNPLAWIAYAAFRFDQEAACDARVLDKAGGPDRIAYGQAIAKAASGRALLFAGALDRPSTLSRRLTIMAQAANPGTRQIGFSLVGGAILIAMPLTATWAINYVDVPGTAPVAPAAPTPPVASVQPVAPVAPVPGVPATLALATAHGVAAHAAGDEPVTLPGGVTLGKGDVAFLSNDNVIIHGRTKRLDQLTRAERSELRAVIAKSRRELEHERGELPARLAEVQRELDRIRSGAYKRELLRDRDDLRRDLAEIDSEAAELRAAGQDPEKVKAEIQAALREAEAIDIDKQLREELADLNPDQIVAELRNDEAQMVRLQTRLDQLDRGEPK